MSFSQTPTPHTRFVANKDQSAIRPNGDRAVEGIFWYFSAVKCGPISVFSFRFYCSVGRGSQLSKAARRANRRASNRHPERAAQPSNTSSTLRPKAETLSAAGSEGPKQA